MNTDNARAQMRKGMLDYCVLLILRGEMSYANDIIRRLKAANLIVVEGTLYPLLTRLKKDGLLSYQWRESAQGPPRKYYSLTDEGRRWLEELDAAWAEMAATVAHLKAGPHAAANPLRDRGEHLPDAPDHLPDAGAEFRDAAADAPHRDDKINTETT